MAGRFRRGLTFEEARTARLEAEVEDLRRQLAEVMGGQNRLSPRTSLPPMDAEEEPNPFGADSGEDEFPHGAPARGPRGWPREGRVHAREPGPERGRSPQRGPNLRLDIPEFEGRMEPEEYLDWLHVIERVFEYEEVPEERRVKVAALRLRRYASLWWDNYNQQRRREGKEKVQTWEKMKKAMNRKFLPERYRMDLFTQLHGLRQETTVAAYTRSFELLMLQCDLQEPVEQTVARYLKGLKPAIMEAVELQPYWGFADVCNLAHKVEKQLARRSIPRAPFNRGIPLNKGSLAPRTGRQPTNPSWSAKGVVAGPSRDKGKEVAKPPEREAQRRCFKCQGFGHIASDCPSRRTITLQEVMEEEEELEELDNVVTEPIWDEAEEFVEEPDEGEMLVIRKALSANPSEEETDQREAIFQTRCTVLGRVCNVIVDSGSCTNVASTTMVEKLKLPTTVHPRPYKLHWLSKDSDIRVTRQTKVEISVGKSYQDVVLCDVVPMDACHVGGPLNVVPT